MRQQLPSQRPWIQDFLLTHRGSHPCDIFDTCVTPHINSLRHHQLLFGLVLCWPERWKILPLFDRDLFIFLYSRFSLVIYFIHISVYMSIPISQFIPPPPPPPCRFPPLVSIRLFSTSVSISALQTCSSVPFFQIPHI